MFRSPLWLAALGPALASAWLLHAWAARRRRAVEEALGLVATLARACEPEPRRKERQALRFAALLFLLLALAGPQWGVELVETRSDARHVVVAMDVSLSMSTPDIKPSRLERAKISLALLLEQLRGERIGVVAFAGDAQVVCPLTLDTDAAKELLGALEVGAVPRPGSAIGTAIRTAAAMLGRYPGGKSVILLTDGEDHRSEPLKAAQEAAAGGARIYAVGIGTPEGEPVPEANGYHKDAKGATVVSRLDEKMLAAAASASGGAYYRSTPGGDEIADIAKRILEQDAARGVGGTANRWTNHFSWPASAAFLLLLAELLLGVRWARRQYAALGLLLLLLGAQKARAATAEGHLRAGNRLYEKDRFEEALERYAEAARRAKDPRPAFNAGDALYRLERGEDAAAAFESAASDKNAPASMRADALYNLGNARGQAGDYAGAAAAFRAALVLAPSDPQSRHNLAVALQRMRNPPDQKQKKDRKKDQPDKPKEDKKDQDKSGGTDKKGQPQPPRSRPQDSLTKEEAERVMRAVNEREKQARKAAQEGKGLRAAAPPPTGEDW